MRIQRGQWDLLCLYYVSLLNSLTPTTNYYHYTSAFLVAAVGLPFVSLALWSRWARASCAGPWRVRGAWGRGPGAVGGGFVGNYPLPLPPPIVYIVGAVSRPLPRWAPLLRCPAPAVAPRAGCALAAVCWVGGAIGWPAVASGSALYYYILHLLYLSP